MKNIKVLNFQNLLIKNDHSDNFAPEEKEALNIVFVRNPYDYFNYLLNDYVKYNKSILFTHDIAKNLKKMPTESFLQWLHTLNCMPFYNPQIFHLDQRKRLPAAMKKLEQFDYVVPYEEIDLFLDNVSIDMEISKENKVVLMPLSLKENALIEVFIDKDLQVYERSLELWDMIKKNEYKPLSTLIERKQHIKNTDKQSEKTFTKMYKGVADRITSTLIAGWIFHIEKEENILLEIYRNNDLLCITRADKPRKDLKDRNIHPTGQCGFKVVFEDPTFKEGDQIEIKILPEHISFPIGPYIKKFLEVKH